MTYRTIFVHVDDAEACTRRLAVACRLARRYPAELLGGYLVPSTDVTPFGSAVLPADVVARRMKEYGDLQHAAEERFRLATSRMRLSPPSSPIGWCTFVVVRCFSSLMSATTKPSASA